MPDIIKSSLYECDDAYRKGALCLAGVDEAGRAPLAGPVVAAAVILPLGCRDLAVDDSKKCSPAKRERLEGLIRERCQVGVGFSSESEIDTVNIFHASLLAMRRAVLNLPHMPEYLLIDGNRTLHLPVPQSALVKGDGRSASIAAASIIAKVTRDRMMAELDRQYPSYGFKKHKGYPTPEHFRTLKALGPCPVHRRSFAPVRELLEEVS